MSYFLFNGQITLHQEHELKGNEVVHIRLARKIKIGEIIEIQDESNLRYRCAIQFIKSKFIVFKAIEQIETLPEPELKIHLFIPLLKEDPLNFILQKGVELGLTTFHFYESEFSKRFYQKEVCVKKYQRWERILDEARKQCGRTKSPVINDCHSFNQSIEIATQIADKTFIFHQSGQSLHQYDKNEKIKSIAYFIGPEGGFSEQELSAMTTPLYSLGKRILRAETAVITALSIFQYQFGDLNSLSS